MFRRAAARGSGRTTIGRRSGPAAEEVWWDPVEQAVAERPVLERRLLGRGWIDAPMVNNEERRDPFGVDEASAHVHAARAARGLVGLDEGRAWRHRDGQRLVVVRVERYRAVDPTAHRAAWQEQGRAALEATWRERWAERDVAPGWVEARAVPPAERPDPLHAFAEAPLGSGPVADVDWFRVEDHTDLAGRGDVTLFEHLTVWQGATQVTVTVRHPLGDDLAPLAARAAEVAHERAAGW